MMDEPRFEASVRNQTVPVSTVVASPTGGNAQLPIGARVAQGTGRFNRVRLTTACAWNSSDSASCEFGQFVHIVSESSVGLHTPVCTVSWSLWLDVVGINWTFQIRARKSAM